MSQTLSSADVGHYIGGAATAGVSTRRQPVYNPATGEVARQVLLGSTADVSAAVAAAQAAFPAWSDMPPIRRGRVMFKFLELVNQHKDTLARMITLEHGKVFTDARAKSAAASTSSSSPVAFRNCSRVTTPSRCPPASTTGRCARPWVWWPASPPSTSR